MWKLREPFFQGAKTYTIEFPNGEKIEISADANGYFHYPRTNLPLGIFAKYEKKNQLTAQRV